jgi:hemerythrin-like metal-binding protein
LIKGGLFVAIVTWTKDLSVGNVALDAQHQRLFGMMNELHDAMIAQKTRDVLGKLLRDLVMYTKTHFNDEERHMSEIKYTGLAAHLLEHQQFTKQVQEVSARFEAGRASAGIETLSLLKDWLLNHIKGVDQKYASK